MRAHASARHHASVLISVLALLATLWLTGCSAAASSARDAPTATATPRTSDWQTVSGAAVAQQAPAGIRIAYQSNASAGKGTLQRSDDGGDSWNDLTWPQVKGVSLPADVVDSSANWSALLPNTLLVWLRLKNDAACPQSNIAPIPIINGVPETSSTTGTVCEMYQVTRDGGATWNAISLPASITGRLTGITDLGATPGAGSLEIQGSRLFALFTMNKQTSYPGRLLASDDGGVTWRLIDSPIATADQQIWDYSTSPTGQTLFALTEPKGTPLRTIPAAYHIWSSPNGGATWTDAGVTPGGRVDCMVAAYNTSSDKPTVYVLADNNQTNVDLNLYASADGGRTWPYTLDLHLEDVGPSESPWLLGALPDGGVAIFDNAGLGATPSDPPTTHVGAISEWRIGLTAVRTLTTFSNLSTLSAVSIQPAANVRTTIWLNGFENSAGQRIIEYTTAP